MNSRYFRKSSRPWVTEWVRGLFKTDFTDVTLVTPVVTSQIYFADHISDQCTDDATRYFLLKPFSNSTRSPKPLLSGAKKNLSNCYSHLLQGFPFPWPCRSEHSWRHPRSQRALPFWEDPRRKDGDIQTCLKSTDTGCPFLILGLLQQFFIGKHQQATTHPEPTLQAAVGVFNMPNSYKYNIDILQNSLNNIDIFQICLYIGLLICLIDISNTPRRQHLSWF